MDEINTYRALNDAIGTAETMRCKGTALIGTVVYRAPQNVDVLAVPDL